MFFFLSLCRLLLFSFIPLPIFFSLCMLPSLSLARSRSVSCSRSLSLNSVTDFFYFTVFRFIFAVTLLNLIAGRYFRLDFTMRIDANTEFYFFFLTLYVSVSVYVLYSYFLLLFFVGVLLFRSSFTYIF